MHAARVTTEILLLFYETERETKKEMLVLVKRARTYKLHAKWAQKWNLLGTLKVTSLDSLGYVGDLSGAAQL